MKYADRKGHRLVVIAGSDEFAAGTWQIKTLSTGTQTTVPDAELADAVLQLLNPG
jgi:histidyl-tRNA synthetase